MKQVLKLVKANNKPDSLFSGRAFSMSFGKRSKPLDLLFINASLRACYLNLKKKAV